MDPSQSIRRTTLRDPLTLATASVTVQRSSRFCDKWLVVLSLPAGEDIAPDIFRFSSEAAAEARANKLLEYLRGRKYTQAV